MWSRHKNWGIKCNAGLTLLFISVWYEISVYCNIIDSTASTATLKSPFMFYYLGCAVLMCSQSAAEMVIHVSLVSGVCLSVAWYWEVSLHCTFWFAHALPQPPAMGRTTEQSSWRLWWRIPFCGENTFTTLLNSVTFSAYTTCWEVVKLIWLATKINEKTFLCDTKSLNRHWGVSLWIAKS